MLYTWEQNIASVNLYFNVEKNCLENKLAERRSQRRELENLLDIGKTNLRLLFKDLYKKQCKKFIVYENVLNKCFSWLVYNW